MQDNLDIRPSPIAGQWYPGDSELLAESVDGYLEAARLPHIEGQLVGVVAPHAGHRYSGPVAGYAFATLKSSDADLVAILSPMHYYVGQSLLTTSHQAYNTPLGPIPVDQQSLKQLNQRLIADIGRGLAPMRNDPEHSLEIELPFLQRALQRDFHLLPIMVRGVSLQIAQNLGRALAQTIQKRRAVIVASTDLSHFYPQRVAERLDSTMLHEVEELNPEGVMQVEREGLGFACGKGALAAALWAARELGANHCQILHYATSGDVTGDYQQVVGYGAAVITRR
jgi:AmmeMemoRadiSam system protein B